MKTDWFPAEVKPVHVGVYEVQNMYGTEHPPLFNYWDGKRWTGAAVQICNLALEEKPHSCAFQDRVWRGVTEKAA